MKPALESELWRRIKKQPHMSGQTPREVIADMLQRGAITSPKQAWAALRKWEARGLYDYGVAEDMGWIREGAQMPPGLLRAELAEALATGPSVAP